MTENSSSSASARAGFTARSCVLCGCDLDKTDEVCPLCGTPAPLMPEQLTDVSAANRKGRHGRGSTLRWNATRALQVAGNARRTAIIAGVVVLVAIIAAVVVVLFLNDQALRNEVAGIDSSSEGQAEQASRSAIVGNEPGSLAGGGALVAVEERLLVARSSGVYSLEKDAKVDEGYKVISDQAKYLNYFDGGLYYVAVPATSRDTALEGTSIRVVENALDVSSAKSTSRVLYQTGDGALVSSLSVSDGRMYFLESSSGAFRCLALPCDAGGQPEEVDSFKAKSAWLFVEGSRIYEVVSSGSSWEVKSKTLGEQGDFSVVAKGEGSLAAACLHDGSLYYSLADGASGSHVFCSDLKGGSRELDGPQGAVRIAASGDRVVAVTKSGELVWFDVVTGFAHDLTKKYTEQMPDAVPSDVSLALAGEKVYLAGTNDMAALIRAGRS